MPKYGHAHLIKPISKANWAEIFQGISGEYFLPISRYKSRLYNAYFPVLIFGPHLVGNRAWPVATTRHKRPTPKSWPTWGTVLVNCYLEIMFFIFIKINLELSIILKPLKTTIHIYYLTGSSSLTQAVYY